MLGTLGRQEALVRRDDQINENGLRRVIGDWLKGHTPPRAVIAMEAVGYQAYYSDRTVIDLAGLVSPAVVAIRRGTGSNAEALIWIDVRGAGLPEGHTIRPNRILRGLSELRQPA